MISSQVRETLNNALKEKFGVNVTLSRAQILDVCEAVGVDSYPSYILCKENRAERNQYCFPPIPGASSIKNRPAVSSSPQAVVPMPQKSSSKATFNIESDSFNENLIPTVDPLFVPFGNYRTVTSVLKSRMFYPLFVTGLSGNGKTYMIQQSCAAISREVIRVNFTVETDEDDLIGGFRLVNGETKFFKGPVIRAMEMGAVLLCDEIDLANPAKVMCLQSILEGSGYFIKKTGEYVEPKEGFTVVATANTKGKGSDDGRFIGTNILNEAFLERFPVTCEQEYPTVAIEKKILGKVFDDLEIEDKEFINKLVDWADIIRKTFYDEGVDEVISTRRLVHIAKAYSIFNNRAKAIELCINRFDKDTQQAFNELYSKIDEEVNQQAPEEESSVNTRAPWE